MNVTAQQDTFVNLGEQICKTFDLHQVSLQWVKYRKNLQLAHYKFGQFHNMQSLLLNLKKKSEFCIEHFIKNKGVKDGKMFFCYPCDEGLYSNVHHWFVAMIGKNGLGNMSDKRKEIEANLARNLATALRGKLGKGPCQLQAYLIDSTTTAYYWAGLLSAIEKDFLHYAEQQWESAHLKRKLFDKLAESVRQVHEDYAGPDMVIAFSDKVYRDEGLIVVCRGA